MSSFDTIREMHSEGRLPIQFAPFLDSDPPPMPARFDFSRVEGMMLGLAIGDALGNTTEGRLTEDRPVSGGEIVDYLVHPYFGDSRGYPSDDSQLAFWTLEQALEDCGLDPERLMRKFANRRIFGIGSTVRQAIAAYHARRPALQCGGNSAGNGALMRIAPVLVPHLRRPSRDLWTDTVAATAITHRDSAAIASSVAFVELLWNLLRTTKPPNHEEWWRPFCGRVAEIEGDALYEPRAVGLRGRTYKLSQFIEQELPPALERRATVAEVSSRWFSAAFLLETVPVVLFILARYGHDPEQAIVRAVNDTFDNDTIAAIVGAAVGALHGRDALPRRWIDGLSGRTQEHDDGAMFGLLASAREAFAPTAFAATGRRPASA